MKVKISKNIFKVKTLTDNYSQSVGMMGKKQCFWMKDCLIPLDILIIKNNVVVNIHENCPPCEEDDCPSYCGRGNIVLEIAGGSCEELGIQPGDSVDYFF